MGGMKGSVEWRKIVSSAHFHGGSSMCAVSVDVLHGLRMVVDRRPSSARRRVVDPVGSQIPNNSNMAVHRCSVSARLGAVDAMRSEVADNLQVPVRRCLVGAPRGAVNAVLPQESNHLYIAVLSGPLST